MEQQGAVARQAPTANADDENSQAEGTAEGAVGYSRPTQDNCTNQQQQAAANGAGGQNVVNNPHYENIYESIEQYNAAAAANNDVVANVVGAGNAAGPADNSNGPSAAVANAPHPQNQQQQNSRAQNSNINYRNDLYDRANNFAYDVPRSVRSSLGMRRNNLQLDLNTNRIRCSGTRGGENLNGISGYGPHRQRSFDDTESYHYYNLNSNVGGAYGSTRYENIYEQIRDEPIYRNTTGGAGNSRMYGRLDVIGHGIGRIERHLSSSCGNIDHYNLGGHYAVLGHSHFGTVGHIRLNASNTSNNAHARDNAGVKSSNSSFFSCLGGENSQSMSNIYRAASSNGGQPFQQTNSTRSNFSSAAAGNSSSKCTGAIPKAKTKQSQTQSSSSKATSAANNSSPEHSSTLNRISKSSLQWLLMNKWLPLWIGQGPDCKIIDFNFMFSRNCDSCDQTSSSNTSSSQRRDLVRFNGRAEMHTRRDPSGRPLRSTLTRLRESECPSARRCFEESNYENVHVQFQNGFEFGRSRDMYESGRSTLPHRARSESPNFADRVCTQRHNSLCSTKYSDPFKNYELNTENNSFKPRTVPKKMRRIALQHEASNETSTSTSSSPTSRDEPGPSGIVFRSNGRRKISCIKGKRLPPVEPVLNAASVDSNDEDLQANLGNSAIVDATEDDQGAEAIAAAMNSGPTGSESVSGEMTDERNNSSGDGFDEAEGNSSNER